MISSVTKTAGKSPSWGADSHMQQNPEYAPISRCPQHFVLGCENLTIAVDHRQLLVTDPLRILTEEPERKNPEIPLQNGWCQEQGS
jgi:hypothetical protein